MTRKQVLTLIALAVTCISILIGVVLYIDIAQQTANARTNTANTLEAIDVTTQQTIEAIKSRDKP